MMKVEPGSLGVNGERLALALEASGAGIYDHAVPLRADTYHSERWAEILGYTIGELPPADEFMEWLAARVHSEDLPGWERAHSDFIDGLAPVYDVEIRMQHWDGRWIWVRARSKAVTRDEKGRVTRVVGVMTDITEKKQAEEALRLSEAKNRALLTSVPDMMFRLSADGTYLEYMPGGGIDPLLPPEEFLGRRVSDVMPPELGERIVRDIASALETRAIQAHEYDLPEGDQVLHFEYRVVPCGDDEVLAMVRDITERKRMEQELRELNEQLEQRVSQRTEELLEVNRNLLRSEQDLGEAQRIAHLGNWKWDIEADRVEWSSELYRILDVDPGQTEPSRFSFLERVHPDDRASIEKSIAGLVAKKEPFSIDHRIVLSDGAVRFVNSMARVEYSEANEPLCLYGICQDITERKTREEDLKVKDGAIASSINGIGITDMDGRLLYVNDSCVKMWGYDSSDEIIGRSLPEFWAGEGVFRTVNELREKGSSRGEDIGVRRDGSPFHAELSASMVRDESGNPLYMVGSFVDISERKKAEEEIRQAYHEIAELKQVLEADNVYLREEIKREFDFEEIIGESDALKSALLRVEQVADTDSTVLILGETGVGKELFSRAVHSRSKRVARPLIKVSCATLPEHLIESELFGHERGAYTGAVKMVRGRFELANNGTIFLDEIGELPLALQAKLLRVLQDGQFERLGSGNTIHTDVRVIAATNRDLERLVAAGRFREDLYYRLNVFPITVPPLRQRKDDIPLLVNHFAKRISDRIGRRLDRIPKAVLDDLMSHSWPGNVRELMHVIERSMISSPGSSLQLSEWLAVVAGEPRPDAFRSLVEIESGHILRVLQNTNWVIEGPRGAAKVLDLNPSTLRARMRKLDIQRPG
jgi:PAS domain S-box-containing protein